MLVENTPKEVMNTIKMLNDKQTQSVAEVYAYLLARRDQKKLAAQSKNVA